MLTCPSYLMSASCRSLSNCARHRFSMSKFFCFSSRKSFLTLSSSSFRSNNDSSSCLILNSPFYEIQYDIKQIMNVFIRAMVRIFSFGERWSVPINSASPRQLRLGTLHLSPQNILTIALINIHYLYSIDTTVNSKCTRHFPSVKITRVIHLPSDRLRHFDGFRGAGTYMLYSYQFWLSCVSNVSIYSVSGR